MLDTVYAMMQHAVKERARLEALILTLNRQSSTGMKPEPHPDRRLSGTLRRITRA